jgi:hypothetical protein
MTEQEKRQRFTATIDFYGVNFEGRVLTKEAAERVVREVSESQKPRKTVADGMRYILKKTWMEEDLSNPGTGRIMAEYEIDGPATWDDFPDRRRDQLIAEKIFGKEVSSGWAAGSLAIMEDSGSIRLPKETLPAYTTDMTAAWLVVEKMLEKVVFTCEVGDSVSNESKYVVIAFDRTPAQNEVRTAAATMPEAICLAAFKAFGIKIEDII